MPTEAVHVSLEEKILMTVSEGLLDSDVDSPHCEVELVNIMYIKVGRDGGLQGLEVLGFLTLRVADESFGRIR